MLDTSHLAEVPLSATPQLPPGTIMAVDNDGSWAAVLKRQLPSGRRGWSYVERIDQVGVLLSTGPGKSKLNVYDPSLKKDAYEDRKEIRAVFAVGDTLAAVGRIVAWDDDDTGRSAAILVSAKPRRWRGSGCSYTEDDTEASLLDAVNFRPGQERSKVRAFVIPLGWE
jgi:hypothetical protein